MKPITKVFLVIGTLALALIIWGLFFNTGGVFQSVYNAMINPINTGWKAVTGGNDNLIKPIADDEAPSTLEDAQDGAVD